MNGYRPFLILLAVPEPFVKCGRARGAVSGQRGSARVSRRAHRLKPVLPLLGWVEIKGEGTSIIQRHSGSARVSPLLGRVEIKGEGTSIIQRHRG